MLDVIFEGATVIDGSGQPARATNVGIKDGKIAHLSDHAGVARQRIDARGAWLTPGFVDLHTHYDGQASWDETLSPSIHHGVTTVVMGNCGVGFAPLHTGNKHRAVEDLISLMEGVEDIPGVALIEGVSFDWTSFPEYMTALERRPHSLDFLLQVPHDPLRMAVMGERALAQEASTEEDVARMRRLLNEALDAGAIGFSTGRTDNHRTTAGQPTPASEADQRELAELASCFQGRNRGVIQLVNDFNVLHGDSGFDSEFDLVELLARESGRPLSMTWLQRDPGGDQWQRIRARTEAAVRARLPIYLQAAPRGIGVLLGLDTTFHPLMGFPLYREIAHLPCRERAAALRDPVRRARLAHESSQKLSGDGSAIPPIVDLMLARIERLSARMFPLANAQDRPNYAPTVQESFYAIAKRKQISPLEALYDYLTEDDGDQLIHFPIFNYNAGSLTVVREMLDHPQMLYGLSDAGAHVGTICDASTSTFLLQYWARDVNPEQRLTPEHAVHILTQRNARYLGLVDRGEIALGKRADLNLIDPERLALRVPHLVRDLPGGTQRLLQYSEGYLGTWVAGEAVIQQGEITTARPGKLVRSA